MHAAAAHAAKGAPHVVRCHRPIDTATVPAIAAAAPARGACLLPLAPTLSP